MANVSRQVSARADQSAPAVRQTQIQGFISQIANDLDYLEKASHAHTEVISSVLRCEPSRVDDGNAKGEDEVLCGTAEALRNFSRRIVGIRLHIENLTARTEA